MGVQVNPHAPAAEVTALETCVLEASAGAPMARVIDPTSVTVVTIVGVDKDRKTARGEQQQERVERQWNAWNR